MSSVQFCEPFELLCEIAMINISKELLHPPLSELASLLPGMSHDVYNRHETNLHERRLNIAIHGQAIITYERAPRMCSLAVPSIYIKD